MKGKILTGILILFILGCTQLDEQRYTPTEILDQKDLLLNKTITVQGIVDDSDFSCTELICPEDNPCCNECEADVVLTDGTNEIVIMSNFEEKDISCVGHETGNSTNCNHIIEECYPFEEGSEYQIRGIFKLDPRSCPTIYYLELIDFNRI